MKLNLERHLRDGQKMKFIVNENNEHYSFSKGYFIINLTEQGQIQDQ